MSWSFRGTAGSPVSCFEHTGLQQDSWPAPWLVCSRMQPAWTQRRGHNAGSNRMTCDHYNSIPTSACHTSAHPALQQCALHGGLAAAALPGLALPTQLHSCVAAVVCCRLSNETHAVAQRKQEQMERMRKAFGLGEVGSGICLLGRSGCR